MLALPWAEKKPESSDVKRGVSLAGTMGQKRKEESDSDWV